MKPEQKAMELPEHIKQKIVEAYPGLHELFYRDCAEFGYSLAQQEIERLKGLIEGTFKSVGMRNLFNQFGENIDEAWQQFKTDNNL